MGLELVLVAPVQVPEFVLEQALLGATLAHSQGKVKHSILTEVLELHLSE